MTTSLISTAIPYVNARPHLGFAYELVLADVLARHRRRRGRDVHFVTGTDDNSLKNVIAAREAGITTRELVDRNAAAFAELCPLLDIAPDDFLRTSTDPRHRSTVEWLWRACAGDLYRRSWTGRYCTGCEAFVDDSVVICDEHHVPPEPVSEENWFFRLSRYREPLRDAIRSGRLAIVPESARAETLAFLDGDVRDLSVSRIASRSGGWGIPVPDDPTQVIYVWFDALVNYISSIGLDGWRAVSERTHVIGKGITRFHAVYWPAFLLSAGLPLPDRLFVHGYLTGDGVKFSKSGHSGPVGPVVERCSADALRWYYLRRCRTRTDSDVSIDAICNAYDGDLADRLGNLVQRCTALAVKLTDGHVPVSHDAPELHALATALPGRIDAALDAFAPDAATAAVIELLDAANRSLEVSAPWRLARTDPTAAVRALHAPLEAARVAAAELEPFVPRLARSITARLGAPLVAGPPPVPRIT
jgi:methionyl-tRNA synthetase